MSRVPRLLSVSSNGSIFFYCSQLWTQKFRRCVPMKRIHTLKFFLHLSKPKMPVVSMNWRGTWVMVMARKLGARSESSRKVSHCCHTGSIQVLKTKTKQTKLHLALWVVNFWAWCWYASLFTGSVGQRACVGEGKTHDYCWESNLCPNNGGITPNLWKVYVRDFPIVKLIFKNFHYTGVQDIDLGTKL